jgi:3-deoxy-7-phosphoheptulonate synthase
MHRQLASGLSMPVGIKNRTDGDIQVAVDALVAARHQHLFPSLTKEGAPALFVTTGNDYGHLVLRGGTSSGQNYTAEHIHEAANLLAKAELPQVIMVDCSHGNSRKNPQNQISVIEDLIEQRKNGQNAIRGVMIESHLKGGRQDYNGSNPLVYGQSITDACLELDETIQLLEKLALNW